MAKTQWNLSPVKEIYCINCHEELILNPTERKGGEIVCPKCKASFCLQEAIDFLRNMSPILEGQCPSCWEDLTFDIEDRINKGKLKCPVCGDSFSMEEVLNPSTKVIEKKEEEKKIKDSSFSQSETITSKGGIVFSTTNDELSRKCKSCGKMYDSENDFYCRNCGNPTFEVPTNKEINFLYDAPEELTQRPSLIYSEFLLNELIPYVSRTVLLGIEPLETPSPQSSYRDKHLEAKLCNSAILYGFAIRVVEEIFWKEKEYHLPSDYYKHIKTVVDDNKFEKALPTNWEGLGLIEPLKGMLLSNYFSYYGFKDYVLDRAFVQSALYKAIMSDSEFQGAYLTYFDDSSIKQSSTTMIKTGYTLGMQLSIKGDENRELGTKSLLSENYRKLLK